MESLKMHVKKIVCLFFSVLFLLYFVPLAFASEKDITNDDLKLIIESTVEWKKAQEGANGK